MTPETRARLEQRLVFLADLFSTRMFTARCADDSARPAFSVDMPVRELDAAVVAMREAAALLFSLEPPQAQEPKE
jgi:hypothetical protein